VSCWVALLARIYKVFPMVSPQYGGSVRVLNLVNEAQSVNKILTHTKGAIEAQIMAPARGPPQAAFEALFFPSEGILRLDSCDSGFIFVINSWDSGFGISILI